MHGQAHSEQWIEWGYLLTAAQLDASTDAALDNGGLRDASSVRSLACNASSAPSFAALVRGPRSIAGLLEEAAPGTYKSVPSVQFPGPMGGGYFSGGYNTRRHGSFSGGTIDGVQMEVNSRLRSYDPGARRAFTRALAAAVGVFTKERYGLDLDLQIGAEEKSTGCECAPGYHGPNGEACTPCDLGFFKSVSGASECVACPPNSVSRTASVSVHECQCNAGFTGADGGHCKGCDDGKFKETLGSAICAVCPRGQYSVLLAATACSKCEVGKSTATQASTSSSQCITSPATCAAPAGYYCHRDAKGSLELFICPSGFSCPGGDTDKERCPTTASVGWAYCPPTSFPTGEDSGAPRWNLYVVVVLPSLIFAGVGLLVWLGVCLVQRRRLTAHQSARHIGGGE